MPDSAESTISRPTRARSPKPRTSTVSPETENKLARAARSAQRFAQLSDAARDGSTLDLFPDDTARAEQQAMSIDVRQGTLQGFELPDVVLAAVGAPEGVGFAAGSAGAQPLAEGKAGVRAVPASKDPGAVIDPHGGQMLIDTEPPVAGSSTDEGQAPVGDGEVVAKAATAVGDTPSQTASLAAASVVRSVTALRQLSATADATDSQVGKAPESRDAMQRPVTPSVKPVTAVRDAAGAVPSSDTDSDASAGGADVPGEIAQPAPRAASHFTAPQMPASRAATPELDHARATAFADTVDALYGVIADQRRAAGDHSRRMKWLLTIVVCALLMTIAIGIAQTLLLLRLAHQSTAQEQRIEQMILNQQATLATLLDTDSSTVSLPVSAQAPAQMAAVPAPAAPSAKLADTRVPHAQHAQRRKLAHTH